MCVVGSWQMVIIAFDVEALYDSGEGTLPTNIKITISEDGQKVHF